MANIPNNSIVPARESSQILFKHLGAVHTQTALTMTQRKLSNVLLRNALNSIGLDKEHQIPMKEILEALDWDSTQKAPETLREGLRDLARIQIQWNILGRDNKNKWTTSALLAHVSIKDGYVFYSYSLALRELFQNPNIYARLNLDVQRKFKNKHAVIIWELICGDLSSKKEEKISTEWLPYEQVLKLTDLLTNNYMTRYTSFRERVLDSAIHEINESSDITVRYEEKRVNRKLTHLRFFGEKKQLTPVGEPLYAQQMRSIGFGEKKIKDIVKHQTEEDITRALAFLVHFTKTTKEPVKNPVALFDKALSEGWCKPAETVVDLGILKEPDMPSHETTECLAMRQALSDLIGTAEYTSWFSSAQLRVENSCLHVFCPSAFVKSTIDIQYKHRLQQILPKGMGCVIE